MPNKLLVRFLFILSFFVASNTFAQVSQSPDGILFQALATDAAGRPAAGRTVNVKAAIISKTATGSVVYSETFKVPASAAGVFTIVLGKGAYVSGVSSIANIDWANGPYFLNLKVAIEPTIPNSSWNVNNEYVDLGTSQFWSVPYALYAGSVKGADTKVNISDTANMLKPYFIADANATTKGKIQLAGDLAGTAALPTVPGLLTKEAIANKSISVITDSSSDIKYPSVKSVKNYVDAQIAAIPPPRPTALATDEFTAGSGQTSFTLTRIPASKVSMFVNGIRIPNAAYNFSGTTLTFDSNNNGSHSLNAGDRVQFDYSYLDN